MWYQNQVQYQQHHVDPYVNSGTAPSCSYTNATLQPPQKTPRMSCANLNSTTVSNSDNSPPTQQSAANMNTRYSILQLNSADHYQHHIQTATWNFYT